MAFNFDSPDVDVAPVIDAIRAQYQLPKLTPEQQQQRQIEREIWREEQARQSEQRRADREHQRAEAIAAANREAAIAAEQARQKARREMRERGRERQREQQIAELHFRARQAEIWQSNVEAAARNSVAYQQRQTLMNQLEHMINGPAPPPEPGPEQTIVVSDEGSPDLGTRDFDPKAWMKKPRAWFQ
jgi:hypothetical protein